MHETDEDFDRLQRLLDHSFERSGEHLRSAFDQKRRLSARDLVDALPGIFEMHLGVVTAAGAPLVAPIDGFLLRGRIGLGIPEKAVRARLVRRDPRVSASFVADAVSFIVHGTLEMVGEGHPLEELFEATTRQLYIEQYGDGFGDWLDSKRATEGRGVAGLIEPRAIFAKR